MSDEKRLSKRTDLKYTFTLSGVKSEFSRDLPPFEVEITDVSTTGIGFTSDVQLMVGEIVKGELKIWTKHKMEVVLKIVRNAVEEDGYSYGSIFVGLQQNDQLGIQIYQMFNDK